MSEYRRAPLDRELQRAPQRTRAIQSRTRNHFPNAHLTFSCRMHPRNPYRTPPDFSELAKVYPTLEPWFVKLAVPAHFR
jgi:hypothetical protein